MIYFDNAATTALCKEAFEEMVKCLESEYGNPGALYKKGRDAKILVETARENIARTLNAGNKEIFFTAGGTEADNWAIKGIAERAGVLQPCKKKGKKDHIVVSEIEHKAVLESCRWLESKGYRVSYVKPDRTGRITAENVIKHINESTFLISVMMVNNELGTIQPVREIAEVAGNNGILFHTDAVAAYGHIPIDVKELGIDIMSTSAHKFNGPKGVGFIYVDEKVDIDPFIHGGMQERGRRGGTENVPAIVGMAAAALRCNINAEEALKVRRKLEDYFVLRLKDSSCRLSTGDRDKERVLPGLFGIYVPWMEKEEFVVRMAMEDICVSAGAACASSYYADSHVLKAVGLSARELSGTVRISLDENNTEEEIDIFFEIMEKIRRNRI
ncbi:MAG: cysteine desulfurase [Lachnospiraceae bacterium]|nr:cysteine desulfurase [Lachnospiraceae bacterium]